MHFIIEQFRQTTTSVQHRPIIGLDREVDPNPRQESDEFTAYHLIERGPFGLTGPVKLVCDHKRRFIPLDPADFDLVCQPPKEFSGGPCFRRPRATERIANELLELYTKVTQTSPEIEARIRELAFDRAIQSELGNAWRRALTESYRQLTPLNPLTAMQTLEACKKIVYRQPPMSDRSERVGILWIDNAGIVRARGLTWTDDTPEQRTHRLVQIGAHRFTGDIANTLDGAF